MSSANVLVGVVAALLLIVYFGHVPLPHTSVAAVDYILKVFYHADISHLTANTITLLLVAPPLGDRIGLSGLARILTFLTLSSSLLLYASHLVLPQIARPTIGFSGVLFGLIVVKNFLLRGSATTVLLEALIQVLPDLWAPRVSFAAHASGIVAGFLYLWLDGHL